MRRFYKTYASTPRTVREIRKDMHSFVRTCRFNLQEISDIIVSVGEAATNAVEHGHMPGTRVEVECIFQDGELGISVADAGGGLRDTEKTWDRALRKAGEGGFGLVIMRSLMDEARLELIPGDGARLRLRKRHRSTKAATHVRQISG